MGNTHPSVKPILKAYALNPNPVFRSRYGKYHLHVISFNETTSTLYDTSLPSTQTVFQDGFNLLPYVPQRAMIFQMTALDAAEKFSLKFLGDILARLDEDEYERRYRSPDPREIASSIYRLLNVQKIIFSDTSGDFVEAIREHVNGIQRQLEGEIVVKNRTGRKLDYIGILDNIILPDTRFDTSVTFELLQSKRTIADLLRDTFRYGNVQDYYNQIKTQPTMYLITETEFIDPKKYFITSRLDILDVILSKETSVEGISLSTVLDAFSGPKYVAFPISLLVDPHVRNYIPPINSEIYPKIPGASPVGVISSTESENVVVYLRPDGTQLEVHQLLYNVNKDPQSYIRVREKVSILEKLNKANQPFVPKILSNNVLFVGGDRQGYAFYWVNYDADSWITFHDFTVDFNPGRKDIRIVMGELCKVLNTIHNMGLAYNNLTPWTVLVRQKDNSSIQNLEYDIRLNGLDFMCQSSNLGLCENKGQLSNIHFLEKRRLERLLNSNSMFPVIRDVWGGYLQEVQEGDWWSFGLMIYYAIQQYRRKTGESNVPLLPTQAYVADRYVDIDLTSNTSYLRNSKSSNPLLIERYIREYVYEKDPEMEIIQHHIDYGNEGSTVYRLDIKRYLSSRYSPSQRKNGCGGS